jgi:hypothetical protein
LKDGAPGLEEVLFVFPKKGRSEQRSVDAFTYLAYIEDDEIDMQYLSIKQRLMPAILEVKHGRKLPGLDENKWTGDALPRFVFARTYRRRAWASPAPIDVPSDPEFDWIYHDLGYGSDSSVIPEPEGPSEEDERIEREMMERFGNAHMGNYDDEFGHPGPPLGLGSEESNWSGYGNWQGGEAGSTNGHTQGLSGNAYDNW